MLPVPRSLYGVCRTLLMLAQYQSVTVDLRVDRTYGRQPLVHDERKYLNVGTSLR